MKRKLPSLDKRYKKHRPLTDEEAVLWQETMKGKSRPSPPVMANAQPALARAEPVPERKKTTARAKKNLPAPQALDTVTRHKIRRGVQPVEAVLDLHGHTRISAHALFIDFIRAAQSRDVRLVLVITGKGRTGTGALRELLPRWCDESPLRGRIIAYDVAGPRHGGEGAWYIRIRKLKPET